MKFAATLCLLFLALPLAAGAQIVRKPATAEDRRANDPKVPDSYVLNEKFDRVLVLRAKFKTDLLTEMEKQVKAQNIKHAVILSGIGSVRGYRFHNVASGDYPVADMFVSVPNRPADLIGMNGYVVNGVIHSHVILALGDDKGTTVSGHLEKGTEVLTFAVVTLGILSNDLGRVDDATYR
jgi:predicted DNA-binding protein with PD1-like motif